MQRNLNAHFYVKFEDKEYTNVILHHTNDDSSEYTVDISVAGIRQRYVVNSIDDRLFVHSRNYGELSLIRKSRYLISIAFTCVVLTLTLWPDMHQHLLEMLQVKEITSLRCQVSPR